MLIFRKVKDLKKHLQKQKKAGLKVRFVPTMGALHAGHLDLVKKAIAPKSISICSIFVNPTQFNDPSDFKNYPITIESDIEKLTLEGCDVLFLPDVNEIYPNGTINKRAINFGFLAQTLEGEHRPGHFDGMAQVVERLLRIVEPDILLMGQKDFQQQLIVQQLIKLRKLPVKLQVCATVREKNGLAMSSRNVRLSATDTKDALELSKALRGITLGIAKLKQNGTITITAISKLIKTKSDSLKKQPNIDLEYLDVRMASSLKPVGRVTSSSKLVALVAAKVGGVRLIDNMTA